jgi:hypothetical protein
MDVDENREGQHAELRRPPGHVLSSAIVSGDSEQDDDDSDSSEDQEFGEEDIFDEVGEYSATGRGEADRGEALFQFNPSDPGHTDELYDQNLDEEDEAYVYKHLRGGIQELTMVRQSNNNHAGTSSAQPVDTNPEDDSATPSMPLKVLKPRNSDAVLSCPCCFNIVCMDCQRHQKYLHQFRAMFVMGIAVDWQSRLIYDEDQRILVPKPQHLPNQVPPDSAPPLNDIGEVADEGIQYKEGEYFPVLCGNCRTQVAALDMVEEVYHFHGCLESS